MVKQFISVILLVLWGSPGWADNTKALKEYYAKYRIKYQGFPVALAHRTLRATGSFYELTNTADSFIPFVTVKLYVKSRGEFSPSRIKPIEYWHYADRFGKKENYVLNFDWLGHLVHSPDHRTTHSIDKPGITHDQLSFQLALRHALLNGDTGPYPINIAYGKELKRYSLSLSGEQIIVTKLGRVPAVGLQRKHSDGVKVTTVWLSKKHNYVPVKITQHHNGKLKIDADILELKWL